MKFTSPIAGMIADVIILIYHTCRQKMAMCYFHSFDFKKLKKNSLRILTGKKHPIIKLQHLQKIQKWTFGLLVHQINSF